MPDRAIVVNPKNDLPAQLRYIGLKSIPANLDDFLARATKARWSPHMLLGRGRPRMLPWETKTILTSIMLSSSGYWVFSQPEICFGD